MKNTPSFRPLFVFGCLLFAFIFGTAGALAQDGAASKEKQTYNQIKAFALTGGSAQVNALVLKKDRTQITLTGTVYLSEPINGQPTGAVFIGEGKFTAETPPNEFEKDNVKRLLGAENIDSDFKTAVFRFTDDTATQVGPAQPGPANDRAQKLALENDGRLMRETGANIPARVAVSVLNGEKPGFFLATFDGGRRGRFSMVLDYQNRIPVANFDINAGEKGLIWAYNSAIYSPEVWLAFYGREDYERGKVAYSDANDQIDIAHFRMDVDLRDYNKRLRVLSHVVVEALQPNLRAVGFRVGESLSEYDDNRLKKQMRVKSVRSGGTELDVIQEGWEGGFTIFLPQTLKPGDKLELDMDVEGDFMMDTEFCKDCHYPRSNTTWYPRHGYLDRSTYELTFRHPKRLRVASVGARLSEGLDPEDKDGAISKFEMKQPVALIVFALGPFKRHSDSVKWEKGGDPTPLEFNSLPGDLAAIKEDFIMAELNNSVRYFTALFGTYPYPSFGAAFHPFPFGQGFPSMLMIPPTDRASKYTYSFIAHETAHQWWGNIVAWRSYRDQWLSEGFAEYSGILYTGLRDSRGAREDLLGQLRSSLKDPPVTLTGVGKGRLVDVGPIILGHRLNTSKTFGAYQALIYNKGALVLRMLHFMMSNPATGEGQPFFDMMTDFVERYRNQTASTDDFRTVVNEHFAKTPIAQKYKMTNLNWLFRQAVYQSELPSYEMQYKIAPEGDGKVIVSGTITQKNAGENWVMVLPVKFGFGGKQEAMGTVIVQGPSTPFQIRLPAAPSKVQLDPDRWILAESISTKGN
ncbi:MAG TPA: M1 family aminopeptidase [Pyrinomonadaceae bacterium]|nr:M1 family aminopeptidase [Pyrinomonadaceae bacterium]